MMIPRSAIEAFVLQVAEQFNPARVILFGSHAYGQPTEDSDVDLLVVMPYRGRSSELATKIRLACPRAFPMDLIVRSPDEVRVALRSGDVFMREVMNKGVVLYERSGARVG